LLEPAAYFIKEILMKTVTKDEIKSFVNDVIKRFNPERVILFGSHASGDITPDSDVDILVVMDFKSRPHQQAFEIRRTIKRSFPLDLLVERSRYAAEKISK
jgi:predicted nucleotidyltransferase